MCIKKGFTPCRRQVTWHLFGCRVGERLFRGRTQCSFRILHRGQDIGALQKGRTVLWHIGVAITLNCASSTATLLDQETNVGQHSLLL